MKSIKRYDLFYSYRIFESILSVDSGFLDIINDIKNGGDYVAIELSKLINTDIKTVINYIKPSANNDEILFVNDGQAQRMISNDEDPFSKKGNIAKIGRSVRQILSTNNIEFTDKQIEDFVNRYKTAHDEKYKEEDDSIKVVKGEDIRKWYLQSNYAEIAGTLGNSCMRYVECQDFLNIYVDNPDVCNMVVYLNEDGKLLGRAIIWKLKEKVNSAEYYLDRIYTRHDSDGEKILHWVEKKYGMIYSHFEGNKDEYKYIVQLNKWKYFEYPYMDSLYYITRDGILSNKIDDKNLRSFYVRAQTTGGGYECPGYRYSKKYGDFFKDADVVWIEDVKDWIKKEDAVESVELGEFFLKDYVMWNEVLKSWIPKDINMVSTKWGDIPEDASMKVCVDLENDIWETWPSHVTLAGKRRQSNTAINVYVKGKRRVFVSPGLVTKVYPEGHTVIDERFRGGEEVINGVYSDHDERFVYGRSDWDSSYETVSIKDGDVITPIGTRLRYDEKEYVIIKDFADYYSIKYSDSVFVSLPFISQILYRKFYQDLDSVKDEKCKSLVNKCHEYLVRDDRSYRIKYQNYIKYKEYGGAMGYFINASFLPELKNQWIFPSEGDINKLKRHIRDHSVNEVIFGQQINSRSSGDVGVSEMVNELLTEKLDILIYYIFVYCLLKDRDDASQYAREKYKLSRMEGSMLRLLTYTDVFGDFANFTYRITRSTTSIDSLDDMETSFDRELHKMRKIVEDKRIELGG